MTLAYEDFSKGRVFALGPKTVAAPEIIEFASEFDAQPMHLSEEAGRASILGGLAASGWHTCAMMMRMMADSYILSSTCQGSPGIEFLEWKRPVLAGDTLEGKSTVMENRTLNSRPGLGLVTFRHELRNQRDEIVCHGDNVVMFAMREHRGTSE